MDSGDAPVPLKRTPSPRWPVAFGLCAIAVSLGLQIWFPRLDSSEINDTWNVDFGGRNAFYQFAQRRWPEVSRNLLPLTRSATTLPPEGTLCILGPVRPPNDAEWSDIIQWVSRGGRVLYAPPWKDPAIEIPFLGVRVVSLEPITGTGGVTLGSSPPPVAPPNPDSDGNRPNSTPAPADGPANSETENSPVPVPPAAVFSLTAIPWQSQAHITGAEPSTVLLRNAQGVQGVEMVHGLGRVVVLASDHLFSNRSLDSDQAPRAGILAVKLLQRLATSDSPLTFDESLNTTGQPRVVGLLLNHWLRPLTLQAVTLLLLFGWAGSLRFGSPVPPRKPPRHSLVEHTDALGNLYWRSGNGLVPLQAYLERLLAELRLGREAERLPKRIDHLANTTGLQPTEIEKRIRMARQATSRRAVRRVDAARLIRLLSELRPRTAHSGGSAPPLVGSSQSS